MTILQIEHAVREFDGWKQMFDSDPVGRAGGGVKRHRILHAAGDRNRVVIQLEFDSTDEATAFERKLHELWGRVGDDLGLEDRRTSVLEVAEDAAY